MTDYRKMSQEALKELQFQFTSRGNLNAAVEIAQFIELYEKRVRVVKGRKVSKGTEGTVFWLKRYDRSKYGDPWGIYSYTQVGFKDDDGNTYFTNYNNLQLVQ